MFERGGLRMRPLEERDVARTVALRADPEVWRQLGDPRMIGEADQQRWLARLAGDPTRRYFALCTAREDFLGIARMDEIDRVHRSARVGGDILPEFQGRGHGRAMLELLVAYCFEELDVHRVWLLVLESNRVARALYEKVGFREEGRQREAIFRGGAYRDYLSMSLLRREWGSGTS